VHCKELPVTTASLSQATEIDIVFATEQLRVYSGSREEPVGTVRERWHSRRSQAQGPPTAVMLPLARPGVPRSTRPLVLWGDAQEQVGLTVGQVTQWQWGGDAPRSR